MHSCPFGHGWARACAWLVALFTLLIPHAGSAQGATQVAVFPVSMSTASLRELAAALDPVLVSKLQELPQVRVATRPALDLPATQLAVDCVGQTRECLRVVTAQSGVDGLIAPSLQLVGQETVINLLYFDARGGGEMQAVTRRYAGPNIEREALDGVPAMLRQLLGIPEPLPEEAQPPALDTSFGNDLDVTPRATAWPALPVLLTASGLAFIGAGTAFGLAARASELEYAGYDASRIADPGMAKLTVNAAERTYERGHTQSILSTVGLAVGGAALVTGVTLWTIHLVKRSERQEDIAIVPQFAPGAFALSLQGQFEL